MGKTVKRVSHPASQAAFDLASSKRTAGIVTVEGSIISIVDFGAREGTRAVRTIDLNDFRLPPTKIHRHPTSLGSRDDLVQGIAEAALYLGRKISPNSKDGANSVAKSIKSIAKFVEFGWLNGLYSWRDWTPAATRKLLNALGPGGWTGALELAARTEKLLEHKLRDEIEPLLIRSLSMSGGYSLKNAFRTELGTNLQQTELVPAKLMIMKHLGIEAKDGSGRHRKGRAKPRLRSCESGMGASHLRQEMTAINLLAEAGDVPALAFLPFPDTVKLSKQFGRAIGHTGNLTPDVVGDLLKEAFWWIEDVADPLLAACEHLLVEIDKGVRAGQILDFKSMFNSLQAAPSLKKLEGVLGASITSIEKNVGAQDVDISLKEAIYALATASFITIGFLNARRKDEITHRKIGLHRKALRVVSRELRLYECEFFIEKTHQAYVPFYVGEITRSAIRVLERLSDVARALTRIWHLDQPVPSDEREDKLFQLPRFGHARSKGGSQWFIFRSGISGHSDLFVSRALQGRYVRIHPHMFRRAYALIHHYRFEHATLQQLCQQLAHLDLAQTVVYVRDVGASADGTPASAYAQPNSKTQRAQTAAISEIKQEIAVVAKERVRELVSQVIDDGPRAKGGFARLIQRFHQRLGGKIEYRLLSRTAQAKMLSDSLVNHGHAFRPMTHANCVASPTRKNRAAKCYSNDTKSLMRERASVSTCTDCPYGHWVEGHHAALEADIESLEYEVSRDSNSVRGRGHVVELSNLKRVLELRRNRLEVAKGQMQ